ncbi:hypothetical protein [Hamadaea tsunoensis]|uniref:hypothetical protein n=1 Tax=Hamadaea tsunoensis TaxID=53368 RepID=UPI00040BACBF|nr:hypothetical protein [Hamadaea tsunoensis]
MSFDLYVWYEPQPITAAAARSKLDRWYAGDTEAFPPHPGVRAVHTALLGRFPALEDLPGAQADVSGVWSMTPVASDTLLILSTVWPRADEVERATLELAMAYGLVCYEPGFDVLHPNAPGYSAAFTLTGAALPTVPEPDDHRLDWAVRRLRPDRFYLVLERDDGWYAQIGVGPAVGVAAGVYVLECREGTAERHVRAETQDVTAAVAFLRDFRAGRPDWRIRHVWRRLEL